MPHHFYIPVLGLGYSIDTPLKVARYGISSVISIVDDELAERMRKFHCEQNHLEYIPIRKNASDSRRQRITAYLNLVNRLVDEQFEQIKQQPFTGHNDIDRYFELLPDESPLKQGYELMREYPDGERRRIFELILRTGMQKGAIDVNIMSKVDKINYDANGENAGDENTDALAALRGYALSDLHSSLVLSAGMNPRLYSYLENFSDFFPDDAGNFRKKIILKVSDFRSAFIQAKFLAKKGLWVSEFRVESGLNCGGHAFATDGLLLGPVLEEFKQRRGEMTAGLWEMCSAALAAKGYTLENRPAQRVCAQGGIGAAGEDRFLLKYYGIDATGWGSPFLLVPEATNVDTATREQLAAAQQSDFRLSNVSPLGVLFNHFEKSSSETERKDRIMRGRPGSPCKKEYLCNNTEFTERPICTASRKYQHLKIKQLQEMSLSKAEYEAGFARITEKTCLCEGLTASVYLANDMLKPRESKAVVICPGPNIVYFKGVYSLDEMVKHIYGGTDLLLHAGRPNLFINELRIYMDYLEKSIAACAGVIDEKKEKYFHKFRQQLLDGITYYKQIGQQIAESTGENPMLLLNELNGAEEKRLTAEVSA